MLWEGGPLLDAYTMRKMLPRFVVAVIAIQLSWEICVWLINLANALGTGIADIMAAPFGGREALEFIPLLNRLSEAWTIALGFATTASLIGLAIAAVSFGIGGSIIIFFLLVFGSVLVSVLIGLGVLMLRNILVIACVIFAPVAIVLWILPGTEKYWNFWKSNFTMLLLLFPLIMVIIYAGRIAAYIVGDLGAPGLLDFLFLLVAFFAPYFIIFKAFKWGGGLLAAGSSVIAGNSMLKRGQEGLSESRRRRQKQFIADNYKATPKGEELGPLSRRQRFKAALGRGAVRTAGGYPIPTKRATNAMLKEVGEYRSEEIGLEQGKVNQDYLEYQKRGLSISEAKEKIRDKYWTNGDYDQKAAFLNWAEDTKSYMEFGEPEWRMGGHKDKDTGEWVEPEGGWQEDIAKSQEFVDFLHRNPQAYGNFSQRLPRQAAYRSPAAGGAKPEDYLPGGREFEKMAGQPKEVQNERGETIANPDYKPKLVRYLRSGGADARRLATDLADDQAFGSTIKQTDNPASYASWRPEHFGEAASITERLRGDIEKHGLEIDLKAKAAIEPIITTNTEGDLAQYGRQMFQPMVAGGSGSHIDTIVGQEGWLKSRLQGQPIVSSDPGPGPEDDDGGSTVTRQPRPSSGPNSEGGAPAHNAPAGTVAGTPAPSPASSRLAQTQGQNFGNITYGNAESGIQNPSPSTAALSNAVKQGIQRSGLGKTQSGNTVEVHEGDNTVEVTQSIPRASGWSAGPELTYEPTNQALKPQPGATYSPSNPTSGSQRTEPRAIPPDTPTEEFGESGKFPPPKMS